MTQKAHNSPISSHPGRLLGYARVSTTSQNLDVQLRALTEAGVPAELVFTDKISGTQADRPGLAALMAEAREGDTLVLYSLDRLGRSLVHMVTTIDELIRRGVALRSLTDTIDTTTPSGRFQLNVFVAMAEYQRALIVERVQDGLEAARARGVQLGRKSPITPEQVRAIHRLHRAGLSHYKIHRRVGVSKGAVGRVLRGEIKSLAHVSLELPEDEIDVWDTEALAATHDAPAPGGDR